MLFKRLLTNGFILLKRKNSPLVNNFLRNIQVTCKYCNENNDKKDPKAVTDLVYKESFEDLKDKSKNTYLEMIYIFVNRDHVYRRGHVEFIYSAMKSMEEFGVHKDLEVYKALIDVLPKGKFIAANMFQVEFMHYPKQQQCAIDILEQMEDNGVMPDFDMEDQLVAIFGNKAYPLRKFWRMMYWMPKAKNLSPWPIPDPLPKDTFDLAKYAIERISTVDAKSIVTVYQSSDIKESIDDTWIVSSQSDTQQKLLREHDVEKPIYVEGAYKIWIKGIPINYFILRGEPKPYQDDDAYNPDDVSHIQVPIFSFVPPVEKHLKSIPSVHEQDNGVFYSVCATGTSSKDSLLSWIRHLERDGNPDLSKISVVFTLRSGVKEIAKVEDEKVEKIEEK